jgi:hypothetical protein
MKRYESILPIKSLKINDMCCFFENISKAVKRAEMVKSRIPKLKVAGSNPVSRSNKK